MSFLSTHSAYPRDVLETKESPNTIRAQRHSLSALVKEAMQGDTKVHGYVEVGHPGRMIHSLKQELTIFGPTYVVSDHKSFVEDVQSLFFPSHHVIPLDHFKMIKENEIPSQSLDLACCFSGFYPIYEQRIDFFTGSIRRALRTGGSLLLVDPDALTIHKVFNPSDAIRNLQGLDYWEYILKDHGFEKEKTLNNRVVRFIKKPRDKQDFIELFARTPGYRAKPQTYSSSTAWYNDRQTRDEGKFTVYDCWKILRDSWHQPKGSRIRNLLTTAFIIAKFLVRLIVMAPLKWVSHRKGFKDPLTIHMTVQRTLRSRLNNDQIKSLHPGIKFHATAMDDTLLHLEVPRYLPLRQIVTELGKNHFKFDNIAGNKELQVDVLLKEGEELPPFTRDEFRVLYETGDPIDHKKKYVTLNVETAWLNQIMDDLATEGKEITYIHGL